MKEATIQRIEKVEPIENSDFLDKVKVLGWQIVTKRKEYKEGDLCVFVTIDTLLKEKPEFEFLRKTNFRVKTCKLRNTLSQGIVFPLSILPMNIKFNIGDDVSEIIGATHYEKPIPVSLRGLVRGNFPTHLVSKTDEERIQNCPDIINELKGIEVYSSVKMDGTSGTYVNFNDDFQVCSRNNSMKLDGSNVYITIAEKYDIMNKLKGQNIAIQGEIVGENIQGNKMCIKGHKLYIFNIWFINERRYANLDELINICNDMKLEHVPIINKWIFNNTLDELLKMADGYYEGTNNFREGIVIRTTKEIYSNILKGRMSFKVLNNKYLLKNSE